MRDWLKALFGAALVMGAYVAVALNYTPEPSYSREAIAAQERIIKVRRSKRFYPQAGGGSGRFILRIRSRRPARVAPASTLGRGLVPRPARPKHSFKIRAMVAIPFSMMIST